MSLLIRSLCNKADQPEPHTGIQGEGGIGCAEGLEDVCRIGAAV
jgi:hypothetical protein